MMLKEVENETKSAYKREAVIIKKVNTAELRP